MDHQNSEISLCKTEMDRSDIVELYNSRFVLSDEGETVIDPQIAITDVTVMEMCQLLTAWYNGLPDYRNPEFIEVMSPILKGMDDTVKEFLLRRILAIPRLVDEREFVGNHELSFVKLNSVKIDDGKVIVTREIKRGELITLYPSDVVEVESQSDRQFVFSVRTMTSLRGDTDEKTIILETLTKNRRAVALDNFFTIRADDRQEATPAFCGHVVRDGVFAFLDSIPEEREDYLNWTIQGENSKIFSFPEKEPLCAGLLATRDIRVGEEVFISYGAPFWFKTEREVIETCSGEQAEKLAMEIYRENYQGIPEGVGFKEIVAAFLRHHLDKRVSVFKINGVIASYAFYMECTTDIPESKEIWTNFSRDSTEKRYLITQLNNVAGYRETELLKLIREISETYHLIIETPHPIMSLAGFKPTLE